MWRLLESKNIHKQSKKIPPQVLKKYELWKEIVFRHGYEALKGFSGFRDERLQGDREGQRSSRLSLQYRVIYSVNETEITVYILELTPHKY